MFRALFGLLFGALQIGDVVVSLTAVDATAALLATAIAIVTSQYFMCVLHPRPHCRTSHG